MSVPNTGMNFGLAVSLKTANMDYFSNLDNLPFMFDPILCSAINWLSNKNQSYSGYIIQEQSNLQSGSNMVGFYFQQL